MSSRLASHRTALLKLPVVDVNCRHFNQGLWHRTTPLRLRVTGPLPPFMPSSHWQAASPGPGLGVLPVTVTANVTPSHWQVLSLRLTRDRREP